jgi:hypothetical protein
MCHEHNVKSTTDKFLFAREDDTRRPEMFLFYVLLRLLEPSLGSCRSEVQVVQVQVQ